MMKKISLIILPLLFAPLVSSCACVYNNGINDKSDFTITAVKLNVDELNIRVGNEKTQVIATIEAEGEYTDAITLSLADSSLAVLDKSEVKSDEPFYITATKAGETKLTATAKGDTSKSVTISVKVSEIDPVINVTGIELDKSNESIYVGKTTQLISYVLPVNATNQLIRWESSDKNIATVSDSGLVSAISIGKAVIKASSVDGGFSKECNIDVTKELKVGNYYLNGTPNNWTVNGSYELSKNTASTSNNEYMIKFTAKANEEFKVVKYNGEAAPTYYDMGYSGSGYNPTLDGKITLGNNIKVLVDGEYTLYVDFDLYSGSDDARQYKYWVEPGYVQ